MCLFPNSICFIFTLMNMSLSALSAPRVQSSIQNLNIDKHLHCTGKCEATLLSMPSIDLRLEGSLLLADPHRAVESPPSLGLDYFCGYFQ